MTAAPVLSFCIPVHNFGAFLPATLESILPQMHDALEIVVFDGGSTDSTPELMGDICARDPRVSYLRSDVRGGIDADLASCIDAAPGATSTDRWQSPAIDLRWSTILGPW